MALGSFDNPITGSDGQLVINQIQSSNFSLADQTGWQIQKNGDAYFFNITAAGSVTSNTVVIKGSGDGLFVYNGTPASGTLILSISSAAGEDDYGNAYSGPGISLSWPGFANSIQVRPDKKAILIYG